MESANQDETQPMPLDDETQQIPTDSDVSPENMQDDASSAEGTSDNGWDEQPAEGNNSKKSRTRSLPLLIIFSLIALLLIAATSAYGGYLSGINERTNFEGTQVANQVAEQYQLGLQDLEAKRYELARQ
ncbi:MAG: hypothetical protein KAT29_11095, partial [Anaerolineales bacterium]|nr:hypothetical protein [Anaerolineales bacterium]